MEQNKSILLLGISYHTAPAEIRESFRLINDDIVQISKEMKGTFKDIEIVVLSTCNRTEFYLASHHIKSASKYLLEFLRKLRPQVPIFHDQLIRYERNDSDAIQHLFRVTCGLDSSIIGDNQILGQVREASQQAATLQCLGKTLRYLFDQAIRIGKKARHETTICYGGSSIGSTLVGILNEYATKHSLPTLQHILIIGAGKIASDVSKHLSKKIKTQLHFINRTEEKAINLAKACGGKSHQWHDLNNILQTVDCVVVATSSPTIILSKETLLNTNRNRDNELLVIDVGLPRNVEADASMNVINIDSVLEKNKTILSMREKAIPKVEKLIESLIHIIPANSESIHIESAIKNIFLTIEKNSHLLAKELAELKTDSVSDIEQLIKSYWKKALHPHLQYLRNANNNLYNGESF